MSIRNLEFLLNPRSVALVGASETPHSIGRTVAENLLTGGFKGDVFFVNPKRAQILGRPAWADIAALPAAPDLAVIATPPAAVPGVIEALAAKGTRAGIIITAGLDASQKNAVFKTARKTLFRILGPNCLGLIMPGIGLNASFAHLTPKAGDIAFVSQSGALLTAVLDWAEPREIGFSHLVSLGDMTDIDFGDMLDALALDGSVKAILLYIEAVSHTRKFMSAARAAARLKPVVAVKAGKSAEAASAAKSHTGALAGADAVYDAALARAGILRVPTLQALFEAVETLSKPLKITGEKLAILTNGGGLGVLATDALMAAGGTLASLSPETGTALAAALPPTWSDGNPVDIIGDAPAARYEESLEILLNAPEVDAVLVLNCPTAIASPFEAAEAVTRAAARKPGRVFTCWTGEKSARDARDLFARHRIPTFDTPDDAVTGFMQAIAHRRLNADLLETPPSLPDDAAPDTKKARALIEASLAQGRDWMPTPEAKALLALYGIPVIPTRIAATPEEAGRHAEELDVPVALKILSPDITHKVDVGGVALNVEAGAAKRQAEEMLARIRERRPDARIDGFSIEPMVQTRDAHEIILGLFEDPQFGPVVLFGHGGTAVEIVDDKAFGLPPLNLNLARAMMRRTRIWRLLQGYRSVPPADIDGLALLLVRLGQLAADLPEIKELDINPLIVRGDTLSAVDVRIGIGKASMPLSGRLAIRPYPRECEEDVILPDGSRYFLRPIAPMDAPALIDMIAHMSPESVRMRFFAPLKHLPQQMAARLTQIDYDREITFVLTDHGPPGKTPLYAACSLFLDPDRAEGEFAALVRDDHAGKGMGRAVMERLVRYAEAQGVHRIWGDVRRDNSRMLRLCDRLKLAAAPHPDDPSLVRRSFTLAPEQG